MRLRDNNNAATPISAIVILLLVGCAIAVFGLLIGLETAAIKFGIIAYLFLAGSLALSSFSPTARLPGPVVHKNFVPTPLNYMAGRRVKPRLRAFAIVSGLTAVSAPMVALMCVIVAKRYVNSVGTFDRWISILAVVLPVMAYFAARFAFAHGSARLGWITPGEANEYLARHRHWPETWLEKRLEAKPMK